MTTVEQRQAERDRAGAIPLPGAAAAPVVNPKRRGRWPKGVAGIWQGRINRQRREAAARELRDEYEKQCAAVEYTRAALRAGEARQWLLAEQMARVGTMPNLPTNTPKE